jgi:hypothetical protein
MDEAELLSRRIFPRNLTARAAHAVRGNPASARPESGVDNTHPGLEFDQRNLDQSFFPGLRFEFQFQTGARLVGIEPGLLPPGTPLTPDDIGTADDPLHLLYLWGAFGANPGQYRVAQLFGVDGYEVLRTVRDLEAGPVVVLIGRMLPTSDPAGLPGKGLGLLQYGAALNTALATGGMPAVALPPVREASGRLLAAMLVGYRADFLDEAGVIPADVAPAGGLTQSLCSPWQWDFADCGCHYWAASKPDVVIGAEGGDQVLNFQRDRSTPPPATPATSYADWTAGEMTQPAMIAHWETLPVVIAEQETDKAAVTPPLTDPAPWDRERIVAELTYLATIEHALAIEYLYAYYSLAADRVPPGAGASKRTQDVYAAALVLRSIAVDEMRHLRWVNEALQLLGAPISLGRATEFRDGGNHIAGTFQLSPLTPDRLDYFIAVEAPSRMLDDPDRLDGIYGHLLRSLAAGKTGLDAPTTRRLAEIVKMIVDEGHEHWVRFKKIQDLLGDYPSESWLRVLAPPSAHISVGDRLDLADVFYRDLLVGLRVAFEEKPVNRAAAILDARALMYNLDDIAEELAAEGIGLRFALPASPGNPGEDLHQLLSETLGRMNAQLRPGDAAAHSTYARRVARLRSVGVKPVLR